MIRIISLRACALVVTLCLAVMGEPVTAAAAEPGAEISSPADGASVPVGFDGPIVIDTSGPALLDVVCGSGYTDSYEIGNAGRALVAIEPVTTPTTCQIEVSIEATVVATSGFQVEPQVAIVAPADGDRIPSGFSGPFELTMHPDVDGGTGRFVVSCPATGYEDQTSFNLNPGTVNVRVRPLNQPANACTGYAVVGDTVADQITFKVVEHVDFSNGLIDRSFYPTVRDGFLERTRISYTISRGAQATYVVFNDHEQVLRRERQGVSAGRVHWTWDGTLHSRPGEKSQKPGVYYIRVTAFDPFTQEKVGLIGKTRIKTRLLTRNHTVAVSAVRARRQKHGRCGFGASGGLVAIVCDGSPRTSSAQLSHVFTIPRGGRPTYYGIHYIRSYMDSPPGRLYYGRRLLSGGRIEVYVRATGHRSVVITDLYVEYRTRVRQKTPVPSPLKDSMGDLDGQAPRSTQRAGFRTVGGTGLLVRSDASVVSAQEPTSLIWARLS